MYYLKEHKNINNLKGVLNYPLVNKKEEIDLTTEKIEKIKNLLNKINHIIKNKMPHPEKKKMCKNCSYYEFCWV
jgi:CRISPR-associated exonuclease Cas4